MQIVISMPEEVLNSIKTFKGKFICENGYDLIQGIKNSTPLPKGHGDLVTKEQMIDLVEFYQMNPQHFDFVNLIDEIRDEKPIIEAGGSVE